MKAQTSEVFLGILGSNQNIWVPWFQLLIAPRKMFPQYLGISSAHNSYATAVIQGTIWLFLTMTISLQGFKEIV